MKYDCKINKQNKFNLMMTFGVGSFSERRKTESKRGCILKAVENDMQ